MAHNSNHPVLLGVDASYLAQAPDFELWNDPSYAALLDSLGLDFMVYHLFPVVGAGAQGSELTARRIERIDERMRAHGLRYMLNNEDSNWVARAEVDPGVNEYAHPDGTHRWDVRMQWLNRVLPPARPVPGSDGRHLR